MFRPFLKHKLMSEFSAPSRSLSLSLSVKYSDFFPTHKWLSPDSYQIYRLYYHQVADLISYWILCLWKSKELSSDSEIYRGYRVSNWSCGWICCSLKCLIYCSQPEQETDGKLFRQRQMKESFEWGVWFSSPFFHIWHIAIESNILEGHIFVEHWMFCATFYNCCQEHVLIGRGKHKCSRWELMNGLWSIADMDEMSFLMRHPKL